MSLDRRVRALEQRAAAGDAGDGGGGYGGGKRGGGRGRGGGRCPACGGAGALAVVIETPEGLPEPRGCRVCGAVVAVRILRPKPEGNPAALTPGPRAGGVA